MPHRLEAFHSSLQVTLDGKIQAYIFEKSLTSLERFHVYCYIIAHVQVVHSSRIVQCQHELHKIDFLYKMIKRHLLSWIWYSLFFCVGCSVAGIFTILQFCILCEQHPCSRNACGVRHCYLCITIFDCMITYYYYVIIKFILYL